MDTDKFGPGPGADLEFRLRIMPVGFAAALFLAIGIWFLPDVSTGGKAAISVLGALLIGMLSAMTAILKRHIREGKDPNRI